jgi:hypothetical protein
MGTRSTIALEYADGTVGQVYCHWDGYLAHNGKILDNFYMDPFKVRDLIEGGDMSSLSDSVEGCSFYSARGEDCPARKYKDISDYERNSQSEEYDYILRDSAANGGATWFVRCYATDGWVTLDEAFAKFC